MSLSEVEYKEYWTTFKHLESKFLATETYVRFVEQNFKTCSMEYCSLLLLICAAIEKMCRVICNGNYKDMGKFKKAAVDSDYYKYMLNEQIQFNGGTRFTDIQYISPFEAWKGVDEKQHIIDAPWWTAYNDQKHKGMEALKEATFENVLNSLAGLYLLHIYYYNMDKADDEKEIPYYGSELFNMGIEYEKHLSSIISEKDGDIIVG